MCHFRRHSNAFAQRRVRMNGLADIGRIATHLDRQRHFADHVAGIGADDAAADEEALSSCRVKLRSLKIRERT